MKDKLYIILSLLLALNIVSCKSTKGPISIVEIKGEYIPVTSSDNIDPKLNDFVESYKQQLDKQMNKIIGQSDRYMTTGTPESYLTNLTSDILVKLDPKYINNKHADLAFMNVHGIRAPFAEGNITLGDIFSTYPFDNTLSVLEIKGKFLKEIFNAIAKNGMVGVSHNARIKIKNNKVISALINGSDIDDEKVYTVVTLDYLADGNDSMSAFTKAESNTNTNITLRDYMIEYFTKLTQENKPISASLDGRITILK